MSDSSKQRRTETPPRQRASSRVDTEAQQQRLVVIVTSVAVGLALFSILVGFVYEQFWLPSRPVARVAETTLDRGTYYGERRLSLASEVLQNFQLVALFGSNPQFSQQFQGRSPLIDAQLRALRSSEIDPITVDAWVDAQVKQRGAAALNLQVSEEQVVQAIATDLGGIFLPPPVTPAEPITPTESLSETDSTSLLPTARPTPGAAQANDDLTAIVDTIYRLYAGEIIPTGVEPELTEADFRAALLRDYRDQVLNRLIQEQLVPEAAFSYITDPERVRARQVFVAVTPPAAADQAAIDAAFAEALPEAEALAEQLRAEGAEFISIVEAESDDPGSAERGGDLGFFDRNGLSDDGVTYPPALVEAAFALEVGVISDPIRSPFGWHVIEVFEQDIPDGETQLRTARTEALDAWVEEQRAALSVQRFPEPTATPIAEPTPLPAPTVEPIFVPGPPTAVPIPTADPATLTETLELAEPTPTVAP